MRSLAAGDRRDSGRSAVEGIGNRCRSKDMADRAAHRSLILESLDKSRQ